MTRYRKLITVLLSLAATLVFICSTGANDKEKTGNPKRHKPVTFNKDVAPILEVFATYQGRYDLGNDRTYIISREGNRFFGQATANPKRELFAVSETKFSIPEIEVQITFVKNEKGEVVELLYERNDGVLYCKRTKGDAPAEKQKL